MLLDFQPYLESIRTTYEKWWQLYTLTDAAGKQRQAKQTAPTFDFGLMVQTVKQEERREEEKIERFPVLEGIRKYAEQHVLLVGRPGSGKSTALARLMLEEATSPTKIPILVELRYWQGSIEQLILDSLRRHEFAIASLDLVLSQALILFDGVNELPSDEARSQLSAFRRNHPKVPMIFTTRDLSIGGDLGIEKRLEMQPLTEKQMELFIRSYVPEQAEAMLRQLKDRLREFGQTPLLLWMLCGVFQQTGKIPENLGLVFREFTQGYERYLKDDVRIESDRAWWKPVLQQLAWVMMQGEKPTELRVAIGFEEAVRAIAQFLNEKVSYAEDFTRKCLRDLQKHHLIQTGTNPEELEFRHQLIQEYYAAEALSAQLPHLIENELKQNYLNYLKWTEPLALMMAMVKDEALAIRVVRWALEVDLTLGAMLTKAAHSQFGEQLIELIESQEIGGYLKLKLLKEVGSTDIVVSLCKILDEPHLMIFDTSTDALNQVGQFSEMESLIVRLAQQNSESCGSLVGMNSVKDTVCRIAFFHHLKSHSHKKYSSIRIFATSLEDQIDNRLLETLKEEDAFVRSQIVMALGEIGDEAATSTLFSVLINSRYDFEVRSNAASALREVCNEKAINYLVEALQIVEHEYVLDSIISSLGSLFDRSTPLEFLEQAFSSIIEVLKCAEWDDLKASAVRALGEIGNKEAIPELLKVLQSSNDEYLHSATAEALKQLGYSSLEIQDTYANGKLWNLDHDALMSYRNLRIAQNYKLLPELGQLCRVSSFWSLHDEMSIIQHVNKYYNYEIYQAHLEAQKLDRQTPQNSDRSSSSLTLFFSYSHKDEALRDQLATHLSQLKNEGIITAWHDRDITAGTDWANAIETNLNTADIILLLISADFLASKYCYETEMPRAIDRHNNGEARVIPIILRACDWTSAPFGKLQALPIEHGAGAKPVKSWSDQDEAFLAIAQGIRKAAEEIRQKKASR